MKVVCDREKLREALAVANGVIPARSTKPVLENVCLIATDDALEILGTDLEVAMRYRLDGENVKVDEPGPAVIPARVALDFVRDLSGERVTLRSDGEHCVIESGADTSKLVTVDPDEFPVISRFEGDGSFSMQAGTFTRLVNKTVFAAAREAGRYAMHGVLTDVTDGQLRMVATDGRRMALASAPIETRSEPKPAIVPTKGMQLFCRVISDPLDQISLHFSDAQIGLKTKNAEIFARLIDGEFPRYTAVIPEETQNHMEADRELLGRKLRLVSNVTGDDARAVRMKMKKGELEIFGQSVGKGEAEAHMEVEYKSGDSDIAFNPDYVIEGLKNCEGDVVQLDFNDRTSPGKFTLGENYIYVVMPITIDT